VKENTAVTIIRMGGATMQTKEEDIFKSALDGVEYAIKKIVNRMVLLESKDGKRQILTDVDNLKLGSFYQKMKWDEILKSRFQGEFII
jgi:hypothetical protein